MRTRMYGGVRGRKTKIGGKPTFVFLLLDRHRPLQEQALDGPLPHKKALNES